MGCMLVHCSAGVGRTGTFLALYNLWREYQDPRVHSVALLPCVLNMRRQRQSMVQTPVQYIYLVACLNHLVSTEEGDYYETGDGEEEEEDEEKDGNKKEGKTEDEKEANTGEEKKNNAGEENKGNTGEGKVGKSEEEKEAKAAEEKEARNSDKKKESAVEENQGKV